MVSDRRVLIIHRRPGLLRGNLFKDLKSNYQLSQVTPCVFYDNPAFYLGDYETRRIPGSDIEAGMLNRPYYILASELDIDSLKAIIESHGYAEKNSIEKSDNKEGSIEIPRLFKVFKQDNFALPL
ncbi:MAG: hypothetical protein ABIF08_03580 [Nanoarchaeota archaeon]